ncbi:MAG: DUF1223 domain-containing protein [Gammaproteobacteria bacterium]|jgi:hypothetical protein|nr:DUF1223 domain-containing protein [Gammaproteobacteria bacterium]
MKKWLLLFFTLSGFFPYVLSSSNLSFESPVKQVALLELYTSEGCSSCPPADRWLGSLENEDGLWQNFIPIALHVDYWDYIGWKDRFADPAYSARQRRYAREQSLGTVYTPGFTYNGEEWRNWFGKRKLNFPTGNMPGVLKLDLDGSQAKITFSPSKTMRHKLNVNLALLGFDLETTVRAGENKGKKLPHNFVVLAINNADLKWKDNQYITHLNIPTSEIDSNRYGIVAWVNASSKQTPLQTVGGWLQ